MECLVRVVREKYRKTTNSIHEGMKLMLDKNIIPYIQYKDPHIWRD